MEKDVEEFVKWIVSVGCPIELIPNENKLKEALRAELFNVNDLKGRFRPAKEAKEIRERNLRIELCKIKQGNFLIDRKNVPWEYLQYTKLMARKKEIKSVKGNIEKLKEEYNNQISELNERKSIKAKCRKNIESNTTKMNCHEINTSILKEKVQEATKAVTSCESAMCLEINENYHQESFYGKLLILLKNYYATAEAQNVLWEGCESILRNAPSAAVCQDILSHFGTLLDATKELQEKNLCVTNEEKDRLYEYNIGLKHFIYNRIKLLIYLKHFWDKQNELTAMFVEKYNSFKEILCKKISHCNPDYITEYLQMLITDASYRGKLEFLKMEVAKYHTNNKENDFSLNLSKIVKEVDECHKEFLSKTVKVELNIFGVKQVPQKLDLTTKDVRVQVNGLKNKIANDAKMLENNKTSSFIMEKKPTVIKTEGNDPEGFAHDKIKGTTVLNVPPHEDFDYKLPTLECDLERFAKGVQQSESSLRTIFKNTEELAKQTQEILNNAQIYCDFLIDNPMRKFIPNTEKFNGRSYQEYETEFLMHYRQHSASE